MSTVVALHACVFTYLPPYVGRLPDCIPHFIHEGHTRRQHLVACPCRAAFPALHDLQVQRIGCVGRARQFVLQLLRRQGSGPATECSPVA